MGRRLWGRAESDMTEATQQQQQQRCLFIKIMANGLQFSILQE